MQRFENKLLFVLYNKTINGFSVGYTLFVYDIA